jgi:hypothetical protein
VIFGSLWPRKLDTLCNGAPASSSCVAIETRLCHAWDKHVSRLCAMMGHKDIRMVVRYDHERRNIEENAINFLHYEEKKEK